MKECRRAPGSYLTTMFSVAFYTVSLSEKVVSLSLTYMYMYAGSCIKRLQLCWFIVSSLSGCVKFRCFDDFPQEIPTSLKVGCSLV